MATTASVTVLNVPTSITDSSWGVSSPKHSSSIKPPALSNRRQRSAFVCRSSSAGKGGKGAVGRAHDSDRTAIRGRTAKPLVTASPQFPAAIAIQEPAASGVVATASAALLATLLTFAPLVVPDPASAAVPGFGGGNSGPETAKKAEDLLKQADKLNTEDAPPRFGPGRVAPSPGEPEQLSQQAGGGVNEQKVFKDGKAKAESAVSDVKAKTEGTVGKARGFFGFFGRAADSTNGQAQANNVLEKGKDTVKGRAEETKQDTGGLLEKSKDVAKGIAVDAKSRVDSILDKSRDSALGEGGGGLEKSKDVARSTAVDAKSRVDGLLDRGKDSALEGAGATKRQAEGLFEKSRDVAKGAAQDTGDKAGSLLEKGKEAVQSGVDALKSTVSN